MLEICLSEKIQKSKLHDLTRAWEDEVRKGFQNEETLNFVPSRLLKSLSYVNQLVSPIHIHIYTYTIQYISPDAYLLLAHSNIPVITILISKAMTYR